MCFEDPVLHFFYYVLVYMNDKFVFVFIRGCV